MPTSRSAWQMRTITVPQALLDLARDQAGLVATWQCDQFGLGSSTRSRLVISGRWRRQTQGVYGIPGVVKAPRTTSERWSLSHRHQVWTSLLAAPDDAMPAGLTALAVHGVWGLPANLGCEVTYGTGRHAAGCRGVRVRQFRGPVETTTVGGLVVPTVASALIQALPECGRDLAVVLVDNALNRHLISEDDLASIKHAVRGRRGAARLHAVWPLIDGRAESPIESRGRLECRDGGLPPDDLQVEQHDVDEEFLGRGDMGWRRRNGSWVLVEMDGEEVHGTAVAVSKDRRRQNGIASRSRTTTLLRYIGEDLGTGVILRDLRQALEE